MFILVFILDNKLKSVTFRKQPQTASAGIPTDHGCQTWPLPAAGLQGERSWDCSVQLHGVCLRDTQQRQGVPPGVALYNLLLKCGCDQHAFCQLCTKQVGTTLPVFPWRLGIPGTFLMSLLLPLALLCPDILFFQLKSRI